MPACNPIELVLDLPGTAGNFASTPDTAALSFTGTNVLRLPGVASNNASTPDSGATSITGDIDLRVLVLLEQWVNPGTQSAMVFLSKANSGAASDGGYWMRAQGGTTDKTLLFAFSDGVTTFSLASTIPVAAGRLTPLWLRATRVQSTGFTELFYLEGGTWISFATGTLSAGTAIADNATALSIGAHANGSLPVLGTIHLAEVRNGVGIAPPVAKYDPATVAPTSDQVPTTLVSSTGELWTMNGTRWNWRPENEVRTVRLTGVSGRFVSTPDSVGLSITGDIDVRVHITADDYTPFSTTNLLAKHVTTGNQRSYRLLLTPAQLLEFRWSPDGITEIIKASTVGFTTSNGVNKHLRATLDVNNGAAGNDVKFFTSDDGFTWTQLGATVTTAGVTSIFDSTSPVELGSSQNGLTALFTGNIFAAEIRNGIDGTVVANPRFGYAPWDVGDTSGATGTDDIGNTWTLNGTSTTIERAFIADFDVRMEVAPDDWTAPSAQTLLSQFNISGQRSWFWSLQSDGLLRLQTSQNGVTSRSLSISSAFPQVNGVAQWVRFTLDADNGSYQHVLTYYRSNDGLIWTTISVHTVAGIVIVRDSVGAVELGSREIGVTEILAGHVYYAEIRNGVNGPIIAFFDASTSGGTHATQTPSVITQGGTTWTISGSSWQWLLIGGGTFNACGCHTAADYGTSTTDGEGTVADPFTFTLIDPTWVRPMVHIRRSTNQLIPDNVLTVISFDTEVFDTDSMWALGSPTIVTINTTGLYLMGACGQWSGVDGVAEFAFRQNSTTLIDSQEYSFVAITSGHQSGSYLWFLNAGDTLELLVRQDDFAGATSRNLLGHANESIVFWACYVGRKTP